MKLLVIVHQFPPQNLTGTEVYAFKVAQGLAARGHEVTVFHTERDAKAEQFSLSRGEYEGLPLYKAVHNHEFPDFESMYSSKRMEKHLRRVLDEVRPDLVHIQHLHFHSIRYPEIIAERRIPIVFTLAEYLLICLRNGWLTKPGLVLCTGPDLEECTKCAEHWPLPRKARKYWHETEKYWAPEPETRARISLPRFLWKVRRRFTTPPPEPYRDAVATRMREVKQALSHVDQFIAPSRFLMGKFIEAGVVSPERIEHSDYGMDHGPFEGLGPLPPREPGAPLRVGYIGAIGEQKGVDLLIEAFNGLPERGVECRIYGDMKSFPDYAARVREDCLHLDVHLEGRYEMSRIAEVLRGFDVLVVPSVWYENSPLTIHEAFMAGIPVITSDQGGMAELVEHGVNGLHFRMRDAEDLRRQIQRLMDEPELLDRMRDHGTPVKTVPEDAEDLEKRFEALIGAPSAAGR